MNDLSFKRAVAEVLDQVVNGTGESADRLFGEGTAFGRTDVGNDVARAIGDLEGAASALDVTVLELLDSLGLWRADGK